MTRTRWAWTLFLLFAFAAALMQSLNSSPATSGAADLRLSSSNAGPYGARAVYLWMRGMGYPTRSFRRPLTDLDQDVSALMLLDPTQEVTEAQADALFEWLEEGRVLFVAPGLSAQLQFRLEEWVSFELDDTFPADVPGDRVVLDDSGRFEDRRWRYREATPDERGMFPYPIRDVAFQWDARVADPAGERAVLFARDGLGLVAELYVNGGVVVVFADEEMLSNRGLPKAQNVELLASLVEDWIAPGTEVWFDDYHHGERAGGSMAAYLARRRPGLLAAVLLVTGVFVVLRFGRSLLTVPDRARFRRRRPAEFVEALGTLYERSRAVSPTWQALEQVSQRLLEGTPTGHLQPAAADWPERSERLRRALAPGHPPGERDLIQLAEALAGALEPRTKGEDE